MRQRLRGKQSFLYPLFSSLLFSLFSLLRRQNKYSAQSLLTTPQPFAAIWICMRAKISCRFQYHLIRIPEYHWWRSLELVVELWQKAEIGLYLCKVCVLEGGSCRQIGKLFKQCLIYFSFFTSTFGFLHIAEQLPQFWSLWYRFLVLGMLLLNVRCVDSHYFLY